MMGVYSQRRQCATAISEIRNNMHKQEKASEMWIADRAVAYIFAGG